MSSPQIQKAMEVLTNMEKHIENMFLAGLIFATFCCFARPDYNVVLYAFLYVMFAQDDVSVLKFNLALEQ